MIKNIIKTTAVTLGLASVSLFSFTQDNAVSDSAPVEVESTVSNTPTPPALPPVHPAKQFIKKGGYRKI